MLSRLFRRGNGSNTTAPKNPGVSVALHYPVVLIGQSSVDVRDSEAELTSIRGASSLNLNERVIVDSQSRLFDAIRASPVAGQRSILWDMGTSARRYYVELGPQRRASWPEIQSLVLEQVRSPTGTWNADPRAVARVRALRSVEELIEASRESWRWSRD